MITVQTTSLSQTAAQAHLVVKTYGSGATRVRALEEVSLSLLSGAFTAVMGPSGSGKSTLMHCMAGLDTVDSGQIYLGETEVTGLNEKERTILRREKIGFVFQTFNLVPALTAAENIRLPLALGRRRPDREWFEDLTRLLGLSDRLDHTPSELSGGQQQRVAVARALITRPEIVFADEPTGNLDSNSSGQLLGLLRETVDGLGQTVVMVTHDPAAAAHADRVVFLADGRIVDEIHEPSVNEVLDAMRRLDNTVKEV